MEVDTVATDIPFSFILVPKKVLFVRIEANTIITKQFDAPWHTTNTGLQVEFKNRIMPRAGGMISLLLENN
jgi:hypothetical protein